MKRVLKPVITFVSTMLFASSAMSQVSSISSDNLVQYGKEDAYWVADVSCADDSKRPIQRKTDSNNWCGKEVEGFCDTTKESAAKKVCGAQYTSSLSLLEATKQAQNDAAQAEERANRAERERADQRRLADQRIQQQRLEREQQAARQKRVADEEQRIAAEKRNATPAPLETQISIQEELIQIEQEKLDLRRQELELQRRAVEIETELNKGT